MDKIPQEIEQLVKQREELRNQKKFQEADDVRKLIGKRGYIIIDTPNGTQVKKEGTIPEKQIETKKGLIALFGSGEMSPTGRRVHEYLIKDKTPPVNIALLETPAGFEDNPLHWYKKLAEMMEVGLQNFKPNINIVEALRKDGVKSTNNKELLTPLLQADYIHTGAGSPTYALNHLKNSLTYEYINQQLLKNTVLSFASAAAIALSKYALPVYEIYKVGQDIYWEKGLDFFSQFGLNMTIIPHWNNEEGGTEIDTNRCFMGKKRFEKLLQILPTPTSILGIDEQTACILDLNKNEGYVMGNGSTTIMTSQKTTSISPNTTFTLDIFSS